MVLFASGYQQGDVAAVIGCDVKTLRKVFPVECREQRRAGLVLRSGMMARLLDEAEKGNVAACKELDRLIAAEQARAIDGRIGRQDPKASKKITPKGKKEEQQDAARGVEGLFGTRPPPPAQQLN